MEERQTSSLFRPYVNPAGGDPAPRAGGTGGAHRSVDDDPAYGETAGGGHRLPAIPEQRFPEWGGSIEFARWGSARRVRNNGWRRAAAGLHRNWMVAAAVVLGALVAPVVVMAIQDPEAPRAGSRQLGGLVPDGPALDPAWVTPSVPVDLTGFPAGPQRPPAGPPPFPGGAAPPAVPGSPGVSPSGRTARPGSSAPKARPSSPGATAEQPPQNSTAYSTIQGESYDGSSGVQTESDKSGGGVHVGFISTGDWVRYDNLGFTDVPATSLLLSASNAARQNRTGRVELRLDSRSNAPVASMTIPNNGDWFAFSTYRLSIPPTTGVHSVYLTFTSSQNEEFANVDWLSFRH